MKIKMKATYKDVNCIQAVVDRESLIDEDRSVALRTAVITTPATKGKFQARAAYTCWFAGERSVWTRLFLLVAKTAADRAPHGPGAQKGIKILKPFPFFLLSHSYYTCGYFFPHLSSRRFAHEHN
jgi:hypothetical protein